MRYLFMWILAFKKQLQDYYRYFTYSGMVRRLQKIIYWEMRRMLGTCMFSDPKNSIKWWCNKSWWMLMPSVIHVGVMCHAGAKVVATGISIGERGGWTPCPSRRFVLNHLSHPSLLSFVQGIRPFETVVLSQCLSSWENTSAVSPRYVCWMFVGLV